MPIHPPLYACAPGAYYVSPWLRARHTFDHLLAAYPNEQRDALRAATRYEERLRDYEQGIVTRLTPAQIAARYPEEARRHATDGPYYYRPAGGESWADISQRLAPVLDALARTQPGGQLLVVAHNAVILCARKVLLGLDEEEIVDTTSHMIGGAVTRRDSPYWPTPGRSRHAPRVSRAAAPFQQSGRPGRGRSAPQPPCSGRA